MEELHEILDGGAVNELLAESGYSGPDEVERTAKGIAAVLTEDPGLAVDTVLSLVSALEEGDAGVRDTAEAILGRIADDASKVVGALLPDLTEALNDDDPKVRKAASRALSVIGWDDAKQPGRRSTDIGDTALTMDGGTGAIQPEIHLHGGKARGGRPLVTPPPLPSIRDKREGHIVEPSIDEIHETLTRGAIRELLIMNDDKGTGMDERIIDGLLTIFADDPGLVHDTVLSLAGELRADQREVRTSAAGVLGLIGEKAPALTRDAVPGLIGALKCDDPEVRANAAGALGYIGGFESGLVKDAIPALTDALRDTDSVVREVAAGSLETICEADPELARRALPGLTSALEDNDPVVRGFAEESLLVLEASRDGTDQECTSNRRRWRRSGEQWMT